jgi:hypothetical protein
LPVVERVAFFQQALRVKENKGVPELEEIQRMIHS